MPEQRKPSEQTERDYLDEGNALLEKVVSPNFYESDSDFIEFEETLTPDERVLLEAMCWFLPRHMAPYDWNRPFACEIIKMVREHVTGIVTSERALTDERKGTLAQRLYVARVEERNMMAQEYGKFITSPVTVDEIVAELAALRASAPSEGDNS